jgi:hypothetical protein
MALCVINGRVVKRGGGLLSRGGGGGGGGAALTSFTLKSAAAGGSQPFSIAFTLAKGAATNVTTDLPGGAYQAKVMTTWSDGSANHVVVSGDYSATQNATLTVNVTSGTPPTGTALAHADIVSAAPTSVVDCGAFGSASLATRLAAGAPDVVLLAGHRMIEAWYRADIGSDIHCTWYVKLWASGRMHVDVMVENGFLDNGSGALWTNTTRSYTANITIGGSTVLNTAVTHYGHQRYYAHGWIGGDPQMTRLHDTSDIMASKMTPNYPYGPVDSASLDALDRSYVVLDKGPHEENMGGTGSAPAIGLLPNWCAAYLTTPDARSFDAVIVGSLSINSYPISWRTKTTKEAAPLLSGTGNFGNWTADGPNQGGNTVQGAGSLIWDQAHHPCEGYLAYLITGDGVHLETLIMQAGLCFLQRPSSNGTGTARLLSDQIRGYAWSLRTICLYGAITPTAMKGSGTPAHQFRTLIENNYASLKTALLSGDTKAWSGIGFVNDYGGNGTQDGWDYPADTVAPYTGSIPPWQPDFFAGVNGFVSETEPCDNMADLIFVRNRMYRWTIGRLGASGRSSEYDFTRAASYGLKAATDGTGGTWYQSFGKIFEETYGSLNTTATNTLQGSSGSNPATPNGYWGNLTPAIAYAVDHKAPGARAAYRRLTGATNWSTVTGTFTNNPVWGVAPRNAQFSPSTWSLPAAGQSVLIGSNTPNSVRPGAYTSGQFSQATFGSFSSGVFNPWYSRTGAYEISNTGGHNNLYFQGSVIFDLEQATPAWVLQDNANGVAYQLGPVGVSATNGSPYYEYTGTQMPLAGHTYASMIAIQQGNKGSLLWVTRGATGNESVAAPTVHVMDAETGLWSRMASVSLADHAMVEGSGAYDPNTHRYYVSNSQFWSNNFVAYLRGSDNTAQTYSLSGFPPSGTNYTKMFLFPERRLMLWVDAAGLVFGLDLTQAPGSTNIVQLTTSGAFASNNGQSQWRWDIGKGKFVQKPGWTGDVVNTLTPPNDRSLGTGGTWVKGSETIGGAGLPDGIRGPADGVGQYMQNDYVEELDCHIYVSDDANQVAIWRMP